MIGACLMRMNRRRDRLAANLHKAKDRLRKNNAELESRIAHRTAQLISANQDLKFFTSALAAMQQPFGTCRSMCHRIRSSPSSDQMGRVKAH
jgi:C4-dicarboxylate-specific signal transduction histidine kinase